MIEPRNVIMKYEVWTKKLDIFFDTLPGHKNQTVHQTNLEREVFIDKFWNIKCKEDAKS